MKTILIHTILFIFLGFAQAQDTVSKNRLHVQSSQLELKGDGADSATLIITLRDPIGEIVERNGTVNLKVSAGWLEDSSVPMRDGIAKATFLAPILDNESLVFKRSMEITMRLMQSLQGMGPEILTAKDSKAKMTKKMFEVVKDGPNASAMTSVPGSRPEVQVIASMGELKAKVLLNITKVPVEKAVIRSGYYEGKDITGTNTYKMELQAQGNGFDGTLIMGRDRMTIRSEGERKAGFLITYLLEENLVKDFQKEGMALNFKGLPTALKVMPGNTLYMVAPPLYMTWKRDLERPQDQDEEETPETKEQVALIARQNLLPGDGKAKTEIVFLYSDKKGRPISGKRVAFSMMRGGVGMKGGARAELSKHEGVTDANGMIKLFYQAPEFKTDKLQKLGTCKKDHIYADYKEGKESKRVMAEIGILCCTDAKLTLSKIGFEGKYEYDVVIDSPRGSFKGRLSQKLQKSILYTTKGDVPIAEATCQLTGGALTQIEGSLKTKSDKKGEFEIELPMKNWSYFRDYAPKLRPFEFSKAHLHRQSEIKKEIDRFPDMVFRHNLLKELLRIEYALCSEDEEHAEAEESKLQLIGDMVAIGTMAEKLIGDTIDEVVSNGWSFLGGVVSWANNKWKFTKFMDDRLKGVNTRLNNNYLSFGDPNRKGGVKRLLFNKLRGIFDRNSKLGRNTSRLLDDMNSRVFGVLKKVLGGWIQELATIQKWPDNPVKGFLKDKTLVAYREAVQEQVAFLMRTDAMAVQAAFSRAQPRLVRNSGELREHYTNIAGWRMTAEEAKAWKDLTVDLGAATVAVISAAMGNAGAMKTYKKLKDASEKLDTFIAFSGMVLEFNNVGQIWIESIALLERAVSDCRTSSVNSNSTTAIMDPLMKTQHAGFLALPIQDEPSTKDLDEPGGLPPSLSHFPFQNLTIRADAFPKQELMRFDSIFKAWRNWEYEERDLLAQSMAHRSGRAGKLKKLLEDTEDLLTQLKLLALGTCGEKEQKAWNECLEEIQSNCGDIDALTTKVVRDGKEADQRREPLAFRETNSHSHLVKIVVIAGSLGFVSFAILLVMVRKRGKKDITGLNQVPSGEGLILHDGSFVPIQQEVFLIGSASGNQLVLQDPYVIGQHARICFSHEHKCRWIEATQPNIQIHVNGQVGATHWLTPDCEIVLGQTHLWYKI